MYIFYTMSILNREALMEE